MTYLTAWSLSLFLSKTVHDFSDCVVSVFILSKTVHDFSDCMVSVFILSKTVHDFSDCMVSVFIFVQNCTWLLWLHGLCLYFVQNCTWLLWLHGLCLYFCPKLYMTSLTAWSLSLFLSKTVHDFSDCMVSVFIFVLNCTWLIWLHGLCLYFCPKLYMTYLTAWSLSLFCPKLYMTYLTAWSLSLFLSKTVHDLSDCMVSVFIFVQNCTWLTWLNGLYCHNCSGSGPRKWIVDELRNIARFCLISFAVTAEWNLLSNFRS